MHEGRFGRRAYKQASTAQPDLFAAVPQVAPPQPVSPQAALPQPLPLPVLDPAPRTEGSRPQPAPAWASARRWPAPARPVEPRNPPTATEARPSAPLEDERQRASIDAAALDPNGVETLSARIRRLLWQSADREFAVYLVKLKDGREGKVALAARDRPRTNAHVRFTGRWGQYKGERNFRAIHVVEELEPGVRGLLKWIENAEISGVGKQTAVKLHKHFGDGLEQALGDSDALLASGITQARAEALADAWRRHAGEAEVVLYLGRIGLDTWSIKETVRRYGAAARTVIETRPWELADTIPRVGFKSMDEIGRRLGLPDDDRERIHCGIRCALDEATRSNGHTRVPIEILVRQACEVLGVSAGLIRSEIESALEAHGHVANDEFAAPRALFQAEEKTARYLAQLAHRPEGTLPSRDGARTLVRRAADDIGLQLDPGQEEACVLAISTGLCVITGGPGTGKSTTMKVIVRALGALGKDIALTAPTGRAAKRLTEACGADAATCHRLLQFSPSEGGFLHDASNPLPEDWVIADEFSMVDAMLAADLVSAIRPQGGLTIVGDVDQLPSVGPGQVLRDLIASGEIPVARLSVVHRQGPDSGIVAAAHRINAGEYPERPGEPLPGFSVVAPRGIDSIRRTVVDLVSQTLPARGYDPFKDIQVLTAKRNGPLGVADLNDALKAALNPSSTDARSAIIGQETFTIGDRVMQRQNNYAKGVYNGEVGTVVGFATVVRTEDGRSIEERVVRVDYSGYEASYAPRDVHEIERAWATTVHKSQGCEFPVVVFVCPMPHRFMLTRNLAYTAVTRAKQECFVVGDVEALRSAIDTTNTHLRRTGLLQEMRAASSAFDCSTPDEFVPS